MSTHTETPWYWHTDSLGNLSLRTPDRGNLIVMDFARKGMHAAAPRFAKWDGMENGAPRGRMGGVLCTCGAEHPDAAFIVRACNSHAQLVAALWNLANWLDGEAKGYNAQELRGYTLQRLVEDARSALQAAQGE